MCTSLCYESYGLPMSLIFHNQRRKLLFPPDDGPNVHVVGSLTQTASGSSEEKF